MNAEHGRAKPLPPDDRRRAIAEAVIPLLLERGSAVTSREMAAAAGIAEGTVFSVFPDKPSVLVEAVKVSMDPIPVQESLSGIDANLPFDAQLEAAARILSVRSERVAALVGVLMTARPKPDAHPPGARRYVTESNAAILSALTEVIKRHRDHLRVEPATAAALLMDLVFANVHPMALTEGHRSSADLVDIILHGVRRMKQS